MREDEPGHDDIHSTHGKDDDHTGVDQERLRDVPAVPSGQGRPVDDRVDSAAGPGVEASQQPLPDIDALAGTGEVQNVVAGLIATISSGPLPDPQTLESYDRVLPGAAERIVAGYEASTVDVSRREDRIVDAAIERDSNGQSFALLLSLVCIVLAAIFGFMGKTAMAGIMLGPPVVMLIGSFIPERRHTQHKDQGTKP